MKPKRKYYGDSIFTNGAFVTPVKIIIHGVEEWRWLVSSFEDDSFLNGKYVDPKESANSLQDILEEE